MVLIAFSILQKVCAVCLDFSHKGSRVKMCRASVWGQGVGRPHPHHRVERVYSHHACPPLARESLHHSSPTRASEREAADCTAPHAPQTLSNSYPLRSPLNNGMAALRPRAAAASAAVARPVAVRRGGVSSSSRWKLQVPPPPHLPPLYVLGSSLARDV